MRRRTLVGKGYDPSTEPCSVLFESTATSSIKVINDSSEWPNSGWTPIAICIVPKSHEVLTDSSGQNVGGFLSLKGMSTSSPDSGTTSDTNMYFGSSKTDSNFSMGVYNHVITTLDATTNTESGGLSSDTYSYLPTQNIDTSTVDRSNSPYSPSPYVDSDYKSGNHNPLYSTSDYDSTASKNMLQDFNGIGNTLELINASSGTAWKTSTSINNAPSTRGYYPALYCCARFHTNNTKAFKDCTDDELQNGTGFWYMPSVGELGYLAPKIGDVMTVISSLQTKYGTSIAASLNYKYFWVSNTSTNGSPYVVGFNSYMQGPKYCVVGTRGYLSNQFCTRPFIRF